MSWSLNFDKRSAESAGDHAVSTGCSIGYKVHHVGKSSSPEKRNVIFWRVRPSACSLVQKRERNTSTTRRMWPTRRRESVGSFDVSGGSKLMALRPSSGLSTPRGTVSKSLG